MGEERAPAKTKAIVVALVISLAACSAMLGGAIYIRATEENTLRAKLIEGCKQNGNPLRAGLREYIEEVRKEAEHPDPRTLKLLHIDPDNPVIEAITEQRVHHLSFNINVRFKPIDCEAQYK